jgi:hypothetical protein
VTAVEERRKIHDLPRCRGVGQAIVSCGLPARKQYADDKNRSSAPLPSRPAPHCAAAPGIGASLAGNDPAESWTTSSSSFRRGTASGYSISKLRRASSRAWGEAAKPHQPSPRVTRAAARPVSGGKENVRIQKQAHRLVFPAAGSGQRFSLSRTKPVGFLELSKTLAGVRRERVNTGRTEENGAVSAKFDDHKGLFPDAQPIEDALGY